MAPEGSDVFAVDVGRVEFKHDELGGNVAVLHSDDSTRYVYAHLASFVGEPRRVGPGAVIGRVGRTGNAAHTAPHLHFEIHPLEGPPVNPFAALTAARDATLHPEPLPVIPLPPPPDWSAPSSSSSSSSAMPPIDGVAVLFLLWIGLRELERGGRWRLN